MAREMREPSNTRDSFKYRVPFYWKHGSFIQQVVYSPVGAIMQAALFSILVVMGLKSANNGDWVGAAIYFGSLLPIIVPALVISRYPVINKARFNAMIVNDYRNLSSSDFNELKPMAREMLKRRDTKLEEAFRIIVRDRKVNRPKPKLDPEVETKLNKFVNEQLARIDERKQQEEIIREQGWDK